MMIFKEISVHFYYFADLIIQYFDQIRMDHEDTS
jgi:hypothetical protein